MGLRGAAAAAAGEETAAAAVAAAAVASSAERAGEGQRWGWTAHSGVPCGRKPGDRAGNGVNWNGGFLFGISQYEEVKSSFFDTGYDSISDSHVFWIKK